MLFRLCKKGDYGKDYHFNLLEVGNWCLIQSCFTIGMYGRSWPYLNITLGSGRLFSVSFQFWRFGVIIELISRSWFK